MCGVSHPHLASINASLQGFALDAAGKALVQGRKTVDECQAFLLVSVYPSPKRKWEDQRGWLYMGIALRFVRSSNSLTPDGDSFFIAWP